MLRRVYDVLHAVYGYRAWAPGIQETFEAQNALAVRVQERGEPHSEGRPIQRLVEVQRERAYASTLSAVTHVWLAA